MRISTFFYTIKQGLKNIWKNKMFSLASIATMTACIFLFGLFYTIVTNFQSMVKDAESGVAVTVFFDEGISQDKIDEIGDLIRARAEVSNLEFVSADDAWDSFKQTYFEGNEAYLPRDGYEKDEVFEDNQVLKEQLTQLWIKVKAGGQ